LLRSGVTVYRDDISAGGDSGHVAIQLIRRDGVRLTADVIFLDATRRAFTVINSDSHHPLAGIDTIAVPLINAAERLQCPYGRT
jgi:hypothetical protein